MNIVCELIVDGVVLLIKFIVYFLCFCLEVGLYGCDMCGMICQYQFDKVEMVQVVVLEMLYVVFDEMVGYVEVILQKFGLLYCVIMLCMGDMGFLVVKMFDFEVWLFVQNIYCEILSCLNIEVFQVCWMQVCFCNVQGKLEFVYMLNGLGLVVGCMFVVVLENYQNVDGLVMVLEVLCLYMGGMEWIDVLVQML